MQAFTPVAIVACSTTNKGVGTMTSGREIGQAYSKVGRWKLANRSVMINRNSFCIDLQVNTTWQKII